MHTNIRFRLLTLWLFGLLLLLGQTTDVYAQTEEKAKEFNFPEDNQYAPYDGTFIARDYIKLGDDFHFEGGSNNDGTFHGQIDPSLIFPIEYDTDGPEPFSTDNEVGTLPGTVNVSPTGAATYQIPISLPPGTSGMVPNLSIVYNSQSGDGMLGRGWSIGGFLAITRVPTTIYHDGETGGITFGSGLTRYALDGNRLIKTRDDDEITEYRTEIESFSKVIRTEVGDGYTFKVETKDGKTLIYNQTLTLGTDKQLSWLLTKVIDQHDNYYEIIYDDSREGEILPVEIKYTGNLSLEKGSGEWDGEPYNSVKFLYAERTDKNIAYLDGKKLQSTVLLTDIKVYNHDELIRKYSFNYSLGISSRLTEIHLQEDKDSKINSTKIEWEDVASNDWSHDFKQQFWENMPATETKFQFIDDLNNDGLADVIRIGGTTVRVAPTVTDGNDPAETFKIDLPGNVKGAVTGDFYGTGYKQILVATSNKFYMLFPSFFNQTISSIHITDGEYGGFLSVGDFNGDGMTDFLFAEDVGGVFNSGMKLNVYALDQNYTVNNEFHNYLVINEIKQLEEVRVGDFNGDGKSDILTISDKNDDDYEKFRVYQIDGSLQWGAYNIIYNTNLLTKNVEHEFGDFNGDGKIDLLRQSQANNNIWGVYLSNGIDDFVLSAQKSVNSDEVPIAGDFDGNGKEDILLLTDTKDFIHSYQTGELNYRLFAFDGNQIRRISYGTIDISDDYKYRLKKTVNRFDIVGNGKQDVVLNAIVDDFWHTAKWFGHYHICSFFKDTNTNQIVSITDGMNNTADFKFAPLTSTSVHTPIRPAELVADVSPFNQPLYVTESITQPNGVNAAGTKQTYRYAGAKVHRQGKGFLGFSEFATWNNQSKIGSKSVFACNDTYFNTYPVYSETYYSAQGTYNTTDQELIAPTINKHINSTTFEVPTIIDFGNKRFFAYSGSVISTDELTGLSKTTTTEYDNYGNLAYAKESTSDGYTETIYEDYTDEGTWLDSNVGTVTIKKAATEKPIYTRKVSYTYNNEGLPETETSDPDDPTHKIVRTHSYTDFGNIAGTIVEAPNEEDISTNYAYDDYERYVTSETGPLGYTTYRSYNEENGNILTETDINGHTIKYKYDAFGSMIETEAPDGSISFQETEWHDDYTDFGKAITRTKTWTNISNNISYTYFDVLGREIMTEADNFNNKTVKTGQVYNAAGQLYRAYEPFYETDGPGNYAQNLYYTEGRIRWADAPNGNRTRYNYGGTTTTVIAPDGTTTSKTINALGQTIKATDNGGAVFYEYNSAGDPEFIKTYQESETGETTEIVIGIEYDAYRNKKKLIDPDAGTYEYFYDVFGRVIGQKNSNGLSIPDDPDGYTNRIIYDIAGRVTKKISPEGITDYVYDTSLNGNGMLAFESYSSNEGVSNSRTYSYDQLSRPVAAIENFEGEDYIFGYTYDQYGREKTATYPGGVTTTNEYNSDNGYLEKVKYGDQLLWQLKEENEFGQTTRLLKGNGITSYMTYDPVSHMSETVKAGGIVDMEYNFEKETGNLLDRYDHLYGNHENFQYDNLQRLTDITKYVNYATSGVLHTTNYDNTGNITQKTDFASGSLKYELPAKPHALTSVEDAQYIPYFDHNIEYTAFDKAKKIRSSSSMAGSYMLNITYGLDNMRKKTVLTKVGSLYEKTKYFFGSYEKTVTFSGSSTDYYFLPGGAVLIRDEAGREDLYFTYQDHLGSITHITDDAGRLEAEFSYDAWGRSRDAETWEYGSSSLQLLNGRGYTGHEMLPQFGLINMNGRLYDPYVGRMLSPDNFVQMPDNTQNFNRYSYVLNNPLKYTDPSGEFWETVVPYVIGGAMLGAATGAFISVNQGYSFSDKEFKRNMLIGAIGGAALGVGVYYLTDPEPGLQFRRELNGETKRIQEPAVGPRTNTRTYRYNTIPFDPSNPAGGLFNLVMNFLPDPADFRSGRRTLAQEFANGNTGSFTGSNGTLIVPNGNNQLMTSMNGTSSITTGTSNITFTGGSWSGSLPVTGTTNPFMDITYTNPPGATVAIPGSTVQMTYTIDVTTTTPYPYETEMANSRYTRDPVRIHKLKRPWNNATPLREGGKWYYDKYMRKMYDVGLFKVRQ